MDEPITRLIYFPLSSLSVAIIVAAIAGPQWLFTEEKLSKQQLNATIYFKPRGDDSDYITKYTKSSLWILCTVLDDNSPLDYRCKTIDYFPNETYSPDPVDSTNAIQYAITCSTPSLLVANFIHVVSYILLMLAMFSDKHTIYFFVSGISFIISGLLMLIGIILYISIFKSEVGSKMKPKSPMQEEALFTYQYGYSFVLYVVGILLVFCTGLLNVFLYTGFHNEPTLHIKPKESPCFTCPKKYGKVASTNSSRQNSISSPVHRIVLRKDPNCNVHSSQIAKSLNQLYTEPAPEVSPYDPPVGYPVLTRSVSTTTDNLGSPKKSKNGGNLINNMCGFGRSFVANEKVKGKEIKAKPKEVVSRPKDIYWIENNSDDDLSNVFVIEPIESFQRRRRNSLCSNSPAYGTCRQVKSINHSLSDLDKIIATNLMNLDTAHYEKCGNKTLNALNSRTLPRNFIQKNFNYGDNRRTSVTGLFSPNAPIEKSESSPFSYSANNILDPPISYGNNFNHCQLSAFDSNPVWPKVILSSPVHSTYSAPSPWVSGGQATVPPVGNAAKYQRIRNNLNLKKLSNSLDNILNEDDEGSGSSTFDLDRMERERRRSHASLFNGLSVFQSQNGENYSDGTAV